VTDIVGVRYQVQVTQDSSPRKIFFTASRLVAPGSIISYLVEANLYANKSKTRDPRLSVQLRPAAWHNHGSAQQ